MRVQVRRAIEVVERLYHYAGFGQITQSGSSESVHDVIPPGEPGYLNVAASGWIVGHSYTGRKRRSRRSDPKWAKGTEADLDEAASGRAGQ